MIKVAVAAHPPISDKQCYLIGGTTDDIRRVGFVRSRDSLRARAHKSGEAESQSKRVRRRSRVIRNLRLFDTPRPSPFRQHPFSVGTYSTPEHSPCDSLRTYNIWNSLSCCLVVVGDSTPNNSILKSTIPATRTKIPDSQPSPPQSPHPSLPSSPLRIHSRHR